MRLAVFLARRVTQIHGRVSEPIARQKPTTKVGTTRRFQPKNARKCMIRLNAGRQNWHQPRGFCSSWARIGPARFPGNGPTRFPRNGPPGRSRFSSPAACNPASGRGSWSGAAMPVKASHFPGVAPVPPQAPDRGADALCGARHSGHTPQSRASVRAQSDPAIVVHFVA
jgi:hypothetical protein